MKNQKNLDKFAAWIVGEKRINNAPSKPDPVIQYWTSQSNISVVFATIFSSISLGLYLGLLGKLRLVIIPFALAFLYFSFRTWAFGRCARIACSIWK